MTDCFFRQKEFGTIISDFKANFTSVECRYFSKGARILGASEYQQSSTAQHSTDLLCNNGANDTPIPHSPPRHTITTHKHKCSKVSYKPSQLRHAVLLHFIGLPLSILDHCQHDHRHSTNTAVTHGTNCTESL